MLPDRAFEVRRAEILERTPRHSRGCHEHLKIAALLGRPPQGFAGLRLRLGRLLHTNCVESMILLLVTLELGMVVIETGVESGFICLFHEGRWEGRFLCEGAEGQRTAYVLEIFEALSRVIVCIFAMEMLMKIIVAPLEMIRNPWHLLDLTVVCMNLLVSFRGTSSQHVTLVLRWWRMIKFLKLIEEEAILVEEHVKKRLERHDLREPRELLPGHFSKQVSTDRHYSEMVEASSLGEVTSPLANAAYVAKRGSKIGGGLGTVLGTTIGAAVGVLPALFTFGLSIPVFAVVGGGAGLVVGSAVGGATGFAGGWAIRPKVE